MKRPKVTTGAIIEKRGKILLTKRAIKPFKNCWTLPGGHIKPWEKAEQAIIREVKEEINLQIKPKFFGFYEEIFKNFNWHAIVLIFLGKGWGKIKINPEEVKNVGWFSKRQIRKLKLGFKHRQILEDYFKNKI